MIANILGGHGPRADEESYGRAAATRRHERESAVRGVMGGSTIRRVPVPWARAGMAGRRGSRELARSTAMELADRMWEVRKELFTSRAPQRREAGYGGPSGPPGRSCRR